MSTFSRAVRITVTVLIFTCAWRVAPAGAVADDFLAVAGEGDAPAALAEARAAGAWSRAGWLAMVYGGDEAVARELFARALAADGDDAAAIEGAAWLDFLQGRMEPAFAGWRRYLELYPGGDAALAFVTTLRLFDGVVASYPAAPDFLLELAAREDVPPAVRDAAARAAQGLLIQFGRWEDAAALAARQGYLENFALCGVFNKYGLADIDVPFEPETGLSAAPPVTLGEAAWRETQAHFGRVDGGGALGFAAGVAYATTTFTLPPGEYYLEVQSDDWYKAFLGGVEVMARDARDAGPTLLRRRFATDGGRVRLLIKTIRNNDTYSQTDGRWAFKVRVLAAADMAPLTLATSGDLGAVGDVSVAAKETARPAAPEGTMAAFYRGMALLAVGDVVAGDGQVDEAAARAPNCVLFHIAGAYGRMLAGGEYRLAQAKSLLKRARAGDAACVLATEELAVFAAHEGKRDEAVDYYRESLGREPGYVSSLCGLGDVAAREGWGAELRRRAEAAAELNPAAYRAWRLLADYYYDPDTTDRAVEYYKKYLALRADDGDARLRLAEAYLFRGDYARAREQYEELLAAEPFREDGYLGMADVAARQGDDEESRAWFARGSRAVPRSAELWRQWGYYLYGHGAREEGYAALRRALALDAGDFRLRHYLEREGAIAPDAVDAALAVDVDELLSTELSAEKNPHADAVMLLDQTVVYLHDDFTFRESNRNLIRMMNDAGRERWGEITVMADAGTEIIQARTHLPSGEAVDAVSVKDSNGYKVISMEQVAAGATLEVAYDLNVNRRMIFNLFDYYSQPFYMAESAEALAWTRFAFVVPAGDFGGRDRLRFDVGNQRLRAKRVRGGGRTAYIFERRNVPPVVEEAMMPSPDAYAPYVRVSTFGDVETLGEWYRGELWGKLALDGFLRRRLAALDIPAEADDAARAAAVYYYVVRNVESSGGSLYYPAPATVTAFRGHGRTVDRAVLIMALCRELGVPAKLALVGTGGSKKGWNLVTPDMFDTALVYFPTVGPAGTYADPLLDTLAFGEVWTSAYDKPALLVDEDGGAVGRVPIERRSDG